MQQAIGQLDITRRRVLVSLCGAAAMPLLAGAPASASPEEMGAAMAEVLAGAVPKPGRIKLTIPELAENGFSVPVTIAVESPMTEADHVRSIYLFSEKNPQPSVVRFHLTPRSGVAKVATSIRLADSQQVTALARMSDGTFWSATADIVVTLSACLDGG